MNIISREASVSFYFRWAGEIRKLAFFSLLVPVNSFNGEKYAQEPSNKCKTLEDRYNRLDQTLAKPVEYKDAFKATAAPLTLSLLQGYQNFPDYTTSRLLYEMLLYC